MTYTIMIDYPRFKLVYAIETQFGDDLDAIVKYVTEQNSYLDHNWTGDSKKFFIQKNGTQEWSFDGKDWKVDASLKVVY